MKIRDLIAPASVVAGLRAGDKSRLLEALAERGAALAGLDPRNVLDALLRREALGSTGMGEGAAIPHARLAGLARPLGLFARLRSPIDFDAIDGRPVDLVCLVLLPAGGGGEPLSALACIARAMRGSERLKEMRQAPDEAALYRLLAAEA